jgi:predicted nucleic acid-binding protein
LKRYYSDSSFLASVYALDSKSAEAGVVFEGIGTTILISSLVILEVTNALQLRVFRGYGNRADAERAQVALEADIARGFFHILPVTSSVWETARSISMRRSGTLGTRSLDILQVASALVAHADVLLTFDRQQAALAQAEGLDTPIEL